MRAFRITVAVLDETYGPTADLTMSTTVIDDTPGEAYAAVEYQIRTMLVRLKRADEERRGVPVVRRRDNFGFGG